MTSSSFPRERGGPGFQETPLETPGLLRSQENGPWPSRAAEMAAIFMVGDGLIGLPDPKDRADVIAYLSTQGP